MKDLPVTKSLPTTLNEATEMLQRMIAALPKTGGRTDHIYSMFDGCTIAYKGDEALITYQVGARTPFDLGSSPHEYKVTAVPLEQVSVITDQPKRMMQDDYADGLKDEDMRRLVHLLEYNQGQIRLLGETGLSVVNDTNTEIAVNAAYYYPLFVEDIQQEILAIVARMRDLLTDIAKENGSF